MKGFLADLYLRPSCYACAAKCGKSGSDITIGDLWGALSIIGNDDDDKGTSLILMNTDKYDSINVAWIKEIDYFSSITYNPSIVKSVQMPKKRFELFYLFRKSESLDSIVSKLTHIKLYIRIIRYLKRIVKRIIK